jgi:ELWxxDGT repeat protein
VSLTASSAPVVLAAVGSRRVFFTADDGVHGRELWQSDGSAAGTRMLAELRSGTADPGVTALHVRRDGLLLFAADDGVHGSELFVHDPGAVAVADTGGCGTTLAPRLSATDPVLGGSVSVQCQVNVPAAGMVVLGFPGNALLPGSCRVRMDLGLPFALVPVTLPGSAVLAVPASQTLAGLHLVLQPFGGPTQMPLGVDIGNAVHLRLGL